METLEINKDDALKEYKNAGKKGKAILERLYGKQEFSLDITDRVKSFEDACKVLDMDATLPDVSALPKEDQKAIIYYYKAIIVARALNEDWTADWEDSTQKKWCPWFKMGSGFGFSYTDCGYSSTGTYVSSRLCFKTEKLARHVGTEPKLMEHYKIFLTIQK